MQTKIHKDTTSLRKKEIAEDAFALALKEIGPVSILVFLVIILTGNVVLPNMIVIPIGAALVLLWAWRSRTSFSELGLIRPKNWFSTIVIGILFGVSLKLIMKIIVMPLLGAPHINQAFQFLAGNTALLPTAIWQCLLLGLLKS